MTFRVKCFLKKKEEGRTHFCLRRLQVAWTASDGGIRLNGREWHGAAGRSAAGVGPGCGRDVAGVWRDSSKFSRK